MPEDLTPNHARTGPRRTNNLILAAQSPHSGRSRPQSCCRWAPGYAPNISCCCTRGQFHGTGVPPAAETSKRAWTGWRQILKRECVPYGKAARGFQTIGDDEKLVPRRNAAVGSLDGEDRRRGDRQAWSCRGGARHWGWSTAPPRGGD
ncbi:hypothetical protein PVAP13_1KG341705 [Panicum virgatum]|uniref:Uncharacterized protein n=1 Tax=Panicum virgatum TaxID=38727 RepID=A0A8T0XKV7_PANVG|nr:hypothetical protein PVAP13_1KG341705 [Panicum virgatum]